MSWPYPSRSSVSAKTEKMACIDCHYAIAHNEPEGGPGPQELDIKNK